MKKTKKALSILTALALLALPLGAGAPSVSATEYTSGTSADCTVSATVESTYSVSIPAALSLAWDDGNSDYRGTYTIGAKGNIDSLKKLSCAPSASTFTLTGTHNTGNSATANVSQTKTEWAASELSTSSYKETTGTVSVSLTSADVYSGTLTFNYSLADA